jgi:hypothetical protein
MTRSSGSLSADRANCVHRPASHVVMLAGLTLAFVPALVGAQPPLLVVLTDTGKVREGLPVLARASAGLEVSRVLSRGFSGRLLRVYQLEQVFLATRGGPRPQPAYLALTRNQGGFPRVGFYLGDEEKRQTSYVDLHFRQELVGRFGATDQIFPHELAHVILSRLVGSPEGGGSNQVHAVGVRIDAITAFHEGFAEHVQVMAVDDPDAEPTTRALATSRSLRDQADRHTADYRRELSARWAPFGRMRTTFPFWYSGTEQAWRYRAVRANLFARQPRIPERLLSAGDPYAAYLLENALPGEADDPPKSAARMLATEGVVSALFCRWATDASLCYAYRDDSLYERFGTKRIDLSPEENVYLKMIYAFALGRPRDTRAAIACYKQAFPEDADALDRVVRDVLLGQALPAPPEIWLANAAFRTGTTLFDQWRNQSRMHTFDLNAASLVDLLGVPGISVATARDIAAGAPYLGLDDLCRLPGVTPGLYGTFERMAAEMRTLKARGSDEEGKLTISGVLMPYLWRALTALALATALGAWFYWMVVRPRWFRALLDGVGASVIVLSLVWLAGLPALAALLVPVLVFGVPGALWRWRTCGTIAAGSRVLTAWAAAAVPASLLVMPLF